MTIKDRWTKELIEAVDESLGHHTFGKTPVFPIEHLTETLKTLFHLDLFSIEISGGDFYKKESLLKSLGAQPTVVSLELSPLENPLFLAFSNEDLLCLLGLLIAQDTSKSFHESELKKGFFRYLLLQVLIEIKKLNPLPGLTLRFSEKPLAQKESYGIDLTLHFSKMSLPCRIFLPIELQAELHHYFSKKPIPLQQRLNFETLSLPLTLCAGSISLTTEEIQSIRTGDLCILETCSYQPISKKGYFQLFFRRFALFQVKLKEDQIKILDYMVQGEPDFMDSEDRFDQFESEDEEEAKLEDALDDQSSSEEPAFIQPDQIPLEIRIELNSFEMNLADLLELKPGSVIPISKRPEEGVYLTLNQKKIAFGELIQLGDVIGVKILKTY